MLCRCGVSIRCVDASCFDVDVRVRVENVDGIREQRSASMTSSSSSLSSASSSCTSSSASSCFLSASLRVRVLLLVQGENDFCSTARC